MKARLGFSCLLFVACQHAAPPAKGSGTGSTSGGSSGGTASSSGSSGGETTAPLLTVSATTPPNDAPGVDPAIIISVQFSESVQAPASAFSLTRAGVAIDGSVIVSGATLSFTPSQPLINGEYLASLSSAVVDLTGNPLADYTWLFVVGPPLPVIVSSFPPAGATNALPNTSVRVTFNTSIVAASASATALLQGGVAVAGTLAFGADTITFAPTIPLSLATTYVLSVPPGLATVAGQVSTDSLTLTFSTPTNHLSFVTSAKMSGALSDGALTGLAAADQLCQDAADAQGIGKEFVAWLSDSNNHARCRAAGFSGQPTANCGQATLPLAGPWIRLDGVPFMALSSQVTTPAYMVADSPATLSEDAVTSVPSSDAIWSGTDTTYSETTNNCSNWTSTAGMGSTLKVSDVFVPDSDDDVTPCSQSQHLLCVEKGTGGPPLTFPIPALDAKKIVFGTSLTGNANLSTWAAANGATGTDAGDAICRTLASAAGLANASTFTAWLATLATSAPDRLNSDGPWVNMLGEVVATDKAALAANQLLAPIDWNEKGQALPTQIAFAFTGTLNTGVSGTCGDWTDSADATGTTIGRTAATDDSWAGATNGGLCNGPYQLYCFEN